MPVLTPKWPTKADHRFMLKLASMVLSDRIESIPSEFNRLARVFSKAGGSWKSIFNGSAGDIELLKTVMKVAYKHGYLTKKEQWK